MGARVARAGVRSCEDAGVAAVTIGVARSDRVEELR